MKNNNSRKYLNKIIKLLKIYQNLHIVELLRNQEMERMSFVDQVKIFRNLLRFPSVENWWLMLRFSFIKRNQWWRFNVGELFRVKEKKTAATSLSVREYFERNIICYFERFSILFIFFYLFWKIKCYFYFHVICNFMEGNTERMSERRSPCLHKQSERWCYRFFDSLEVLCLLDGCAHAWSFEVFGSLGWPSLLGREAVLECVGSQIHRSYESKKLRNTLKLLKTKDGSWNFKKLLQYSSRHDFYCVLLLRGWESTCLTAVKHITERFPIMLLDKWIAKRILPEMRDGGRHCPYENPAKIAIILCRSLIKGSEKPFSRRGNPFHLLTLFPLALIKIYFIPEFHLYSLLN